MKKCPNGMYSEIKYDGERVQVHKNGNVFSYFSRSLKPVLPHKVSLITDAHITYTHTQWRTASASLNVYFLFLYIRLCSVFIFNFMGLITVFLGLCGH